MESFYIILVKAIKRKSKTRAKFEETIATWLLNEWLTEEEATNLMLLLDEYFPA